MQFKIVGNEWHAVGEQLEYHVRYHQAGPTYRLFILQGDTVVYCADSVKRTRLFVWAKCFEADPYAHTQLSRAERTDQLARSIGVEIDSYTPARVTA